MSGHSKWSTIKRKKELTDAKKGKSFTKMANLVTIAARDGGADPETNFKLRLAIDKAKEYNVPAINIQRAIEKGKGGSRENLLVQEEYEAYGPFGVALMIDVVTDNKNRTVSELRKVFRDCGGRLAEKGSVSWLFEKNGVVEVDVSKKNKDQKEELSLFAIDNKVVDVKDLGGEMVFLCKVSDLREVKRFLVKREEKIISVNIVLIKKNEVLIRDPVFVEKIEKIIEELEGRDDVIRVYTNFKKG